MKRIKVICDRCGKEIQWCGNDMIHDFIASEFPGQDICLRCSNEIDLRTIIARESALRNVPEAQVAKEYYERYSDG